MDEDYRCSSVRGIVRRIFQELCCAIVPPHEVDEHVLVQDGRIYATSFRFRGWLAMWLMSIGLVQFYDPQGNLVKTISLLGDQRDLRLVA